MDSAISDTFFLNFICIENVVKLLFLILFGKTW